MPRESTLSQRVEDLERITKRALDEISQMRRELQARGLPLPPYRPGRPPLSAASRRLFLQRAAARARAAKRVGSGKGSVRSEGTASRLREQAEAFEGGDPNEHQ